MSKWLNLMLKEAIKSSNNYHYHRDKGHDIEGCIELRKMLGEMIAQRKLKDFLNHDHSSCGDSSRGRKCDAENDEDARPP